MSANDDGWRVQLSVSMANKQVMLNVRGDDVAEVMTKLSQGLGEEIATAADARLREAIVISEQQAMANVQQQGFTPQQGGQAPQQQQQGGQPKGYGDPCPTCGTPKTEIRSGKWGPWAACPQGPHR